MPRTIMSKSEILIFIRSLLVSNKEKYELSQFLNDFEEETGYSMPCFEYGNVYDFFKSIPHTVQVISMGKHMYLKLVESQKSVNVRFAVVETELPNRRKHTYVPERDNSSSSSDPLEVPEEISEVNAASMPVHRSEMQRRRCRNPIFRTSQNEIQQLIKKNITCPLCGNVEKNYCGFIPVDKIVLPFNIQEDDLSNICFYRHLKPREKIPICVPEIANVHWFTIQLRRFKNELATLMGKMLSFYSIFGDSYTIPHDKLRQDQICAVYYNTRPDFPEWYRGKILHVGDEISVVFLVDYGLTVDVYRSDIKYLHRDFAELPKQALHGYLNGVRPLVGIYWSQRSIERFFELTFEKNLIAEIVEVNIERNMLCVTLANEKSHDIGNILVEEKIVYSEFDRGRHSVFPNLFMSYNLKGFVEPEAMERKRTLRCLAEDSE